MYYLLHIIYYYLLGNILHCLLYPKNCDKNVKRKNNSSKQFTVQQMETEEKQMTMVHCGKWPDTKEKTRYPEV